MTPRLHPALLTVSFLVLATAASAQTPGPPTNLTAVVNANLTITLNWAPPSTGGAPTGYIVQIGSTPGTNDVLNQQIGNVTTFTTTNGLGIGQTWYVRVRALNGSGISAPSAELTVTRACVSPALVPESVTWRANVTAVQVTWVPTVDAADYRVEVGTALGLSDVAVVTTNSRTTYVTVPLPGAGTYYVRVRGLQNCGAGPATADVVITAAATVPPAPVLVNEFGGFVELKNVSTAPINIGFWRIHTSFGFDQTIARVATIRDNVTLAPGCTYLLAEPGSLTVSTDEPLSRSISEGVALVGRDGRIVDAAGRRNSFDIADPNTPYIEGQPLPARRDSAGIESFARAGDLDTNNNQADFVALTKSNPQNSSACQGGPVPPIPPIPPPGPPPPTNLISAVSGNSVTLGWTPPAGPITAYQIEVGTVPGASNAGVAALGGQLSAISFNGVGNGTYYVRLRTIRGADLSAPSNEVTVLVCSACVTPPGPVTQLQSQVSGSTVLLQWNRPSSGGAPTGFVVEAGSASGLADLAVFPTGSVAEFVIVNGVPRGTYFVRVRALSGTTPGPASSEVVVVVP